MEDMLDVKVSINRASDEKIYLTIKDVSSSVVFAEIIMNPEDFGKAITGLSLQKAKCIVKKLEFVGKTKIVEKRQIECPEFAGNYNKKTLENWLVENCQEEGWILNSYLGSQNSVIRVDGGKRFINYSVEKYE